MLDGSSALATVDVNQELTPGTFNEDGVDWLDLGQFTITGSTLNVQLSDDANEFVMADAIRIERLSTVDSLSVSIDPSSFSENGGSATGTVTRTGDTSGALTVNLTSNDTSEATVPATVQILAGQASATFAVTAQDDGDSDGTQTVTVSATASGYVGGQTTIDVTDDESPPAFIAIIDDGDAGYSDTGTWGTGGARAQRGHALERRRERRGRGDVVVHRAHRGRVPRVGDVGGSREPRNRCAVHRARRLECAGDR